MIDDAELFSLIDVRPSESGVRLRYEKQRKGRYCSVVLGTGDGAR